MKIKGIRVAKLNHAIQAGDWHDAPMRWTVTGPGSEVQHNQTRKGAELYAKIRRNSADQSTAINAYVLAA
jgi:hypothetical protein